QKEKLPIVQTQIARKGNFPLQIITNGKLEAKEKACLRFEKSGIVAHIYCKNGQFVKKGELIAELGHKTDELDIQEAITQLKAATIELQSLALGFEPLKGDTTKIPKEVLTNLKIQSRFTQALNTLKRAKYNRQKSFLYAPISGIVANLKSKSHQPSPDKDDFCWIINPNTFEAHAYIMESDLNWIKNNQTVKIRPISISNQEIKGKISSINPQVNENGLVEICASISNKDKNLFDGMNVEMICEKNVPNQLIVPREAIVLRAEKKVIFTYKDGLAWWNYVETSFENENEIVITKGLKIDDEVIFKGHYNLNHEVKVMKDSHQS
ncbi:MAG: efflux RND transporter periplasmic adaptor subunit, partial [Bacteroidales bacterium]